MKKILFASALVASLFSSNLVAKEYVIDKAHSTVGFKIKHLSISNVTGLFKDYDALIDYENGEIKRLEAKVKVASVNTENKGRDDHLQKDDFFNAKKYPEITFTMKSFKKVKNSAKIVGTLNLVGVSKDIELDADIGGTAEQRGVEKLGFSLSGKIKRSDFKFAPGSSTVALGDDVFINIEVEANAK
ncbi:YceI family protein [Campylobacter troglodytis]|uniref:YceI family protein n=1 Tax=Campylobacter troglodytis TaxID=654363 RepID=UPI0011596BA3|nr:YceI family protein [Campylobacter troglodytis]TQR58167.1 protein yceI precursor [Campylobacter troglodytis]